MKKGIVIGSILAVFLMVLLPTTSLAESSTAIERIQKQQIILKELQDKIYTKQWEPTCILRLLLWIRNAVLISLYITILIISRLLKHHNSTAIWWNLKTQKNQNTLHYLLVLNRNYNILFFFYIYKSHLFVILEILYFIK